MNKNKIVIIVFTLIFFTGIFIVKNQQHSSVAAASTKIQVVASFYPLYYFASEIGKEKADVQNITPPGSEPHDYDPSTQDIAKITKSNMLILNGGIEAWGEKIKQNLAGTQVKIIIAGEGLETQQIEEEGQKKTDPHIWLDPILAKKEAAAITEGYITIDPANKDFYIQNEKVLDERFDLLDGDYKRGLASCRSKDIITSHAAFSYLAARYGLRQVSIAGLSPDEEPSAKQLVQIVDFAKRNNVKYIFFESLVSPKLAETIAREIGVKTLVLDPIEGISDDDVKKGENYFTVMESNLKNLQIALDCSSS